VLVSLYGLCLLYQNAITVARVSERKGANVPIVQIHLLGGRSGAAKDTLVRELTAAVERALGSTPERIQVLVTEYAEGDWTVAGEPLTLPEGSAS